MRIAFNWSLELEFVARDIGKLKGVFRAFFVVFFFFSGCFFVVWYPCSHAETPDIVGISESGLWLHRSEFKICARWLRATIIGTLKRGFGATQQEGYGSWMWIDRDENK